MQILKNFQFIEKLGSFLLTLPPPRCFEIFVNANLTQIPRKVDHTAR